jgi:D-beta-D-heptose 7-phosphate kinase/D-beta-D-heptose 1-phosphate adenosyltransferase
MNHFSGRILGKLLRDESIDDHLVITDSSRPTTVKDRFVGRAAERHPHQIVRVDRESREPLAEELQDRLIAGVATELRRCDVLLVSDYAKGVCTPRVLEMAIKVAKDRGVQVIIDPAKLSEYGRYCGATALKPNRREAELVCGSPITGPEDALQVGANLCKALNLAAVLLTLDSQGMVVVTADGTARAVSARSRKVYDITGAGDMALAAFGLGRAAGWDCIDAAELANTAAGLEVEHFGVSTITRRELIAELQHGMCRRPPTSPKGKHSSFAQECSSKILSIEEVVAIADEHRRASRRVVLTNGCFDLLHVGHLTVLQEAANLGDVLIVAINGDESVRRLKGPGRPVISEGQRVALLSALSCVDHVLVFDEETPHDLLRRIRPDVLVKGGTYEPNEVVGCEIVKAYGGQVHVTSQADGISTTAILASMQASHERAVSVESAMRKRDLVGP